MSAALNPRAIAARVVHDVAGRGRFLDTALAEQFEALAPASSTPALIQELAYGTLRWYHQLAGIAALFLSKPLKPKDGDIHALLLVGLYQLRFMRIAPHAAVSETVEAAQALGKPWAKSLLNACLRAALRAPDEIAAAVAGSAVLRYSHPQWLIDATQQAFPQTWEQVLTANNQRPPMTLRVNRRRATVPGYIARLNAAGMSARPCAPADSALMLATPVPVEKLPGFDAGLVSVQDAAAQWAAVLLDAQPGERVLDACVAPGGKAAHILERGSRIDLVGIDVDGTRLARARANFARLGLNGHLIQADATDARAWWDGVPFDRILVDAPCSGTGVIRRHPDIKVRRAPEDIAAARATQAGILAGVWPCLRRGGKLLYATCSVLPDENRLQIQEFLTRCPDATRANLRTDVCDWQIPTGEADMDGFYYAAIDKI